MLLLVGVWGAVGPRIGLDNCMLCQKVGVGISIVRVIRGGWDNAAGAEG